MTQIKKHKKAIKILKLIKILDNRILSNEKYILLSNEFFFKGMKEHYKFRIEVDFMIKERLLNHYKNNFNL